jgi:hypothetical protein
MLKRCGEAQLFCVGDPLVETESANLGSRPAHDRGFHALSAEMDSGRSLLQATKEALRSPPLIIYCVANEV